MKVRSNTLTTVEDQLQGFGAEAIVQNLFMVSIHLPSIFTPPQAEMAKRNSVGSHDMPRQNEFRPAYGTAQDSDDVRS